MMPLPPAVPPMAIKDLPLMPLPPGYKLPPLGTKTPQKSDFGDNRPSGNSKPMAPLPKDMPMLSPPVIDDSPYMDAGYGFRAPEYVRGPYLDSAQLKTLNHQGLLPSAVPTPAVSYRRYFVFVSVTPAVSKLWVVAPNSVSPNVLFEHLMLLPYNRDANRHTFVIQDHDYTVAMIVKDSTRFGLTYYRERLPLDQILQMLQKQGIETPGIVEVSQTAQMLPALSPDQQTIRTNVYDLKSHPELGHMAVSVKLTTAELWPLLCLLTAPLFLVIVRVLLSRPSDLPDNERQAAANRIYVRTMLAAIMLMSAAFVASINAQLSLYAMWFAPGLVKWVVAVPMAISMLVPIVGWEILRYTARSKRLNATDRLDAYPELQRMRAQHKLIVNGGFIVALVLSMYMSGRVPYSIMPFVIFIPIFVFIGVLALLKKREDVTLLRLIPAHADDYKERLSKIRSDAAALSALRGIRCPEIQVVDILNSGREMSVLKTGNNLMISPSAFDTLNDEEIKFLTYASLLSDEGKWMGLAQIIGFAIFAVFITLLPDDLGPIPIIIWGSATAYGIPILVSIMRFRVADRLAVNIIGNPQAAISALRKMHANAPGNWVLTTRLRTLEGDSIRIT